MFSCSHSDPMREQCLQLTDMSLRMIAFVGGQLSSSVFFLFVCHQLPVTVLFTSAIRGSLAWTTRLPGTVRWSTSSSSQAWCLHTHAPTTRRWIPANDQQSSCTIATSTLCLSSTRTTTTSRLSAAYAPSWCKTCCSTASGQEYEPSLVPDLPVFFVISKEKKRLWMDWSCAC